MSTPNKIIYYGGTNVLGFLMNQERKHWLLKTDKKKQVQDDVTGDIFQGQIDNRGSNIVVKSEKVPYKTNMLSEIRFGTSDLNKILSPAYSAFTYSSAVNGLMFARIESMSYPYTTDTDVEYKNYRIQFTNATEIYIPFAASASSDEVYATKWIRTTTRPKLQMMDGEGEYTISTDVLFANDVTNVTYYYPLDSNMSMLTIHRTGVNGTYVTDQVNSDTQIGFPLFWFTCDNTNVGPNSTISDNTSLQGKQLVYFGNEGTESKYVAHMYVGIDGNMDATPDDSTTDEWTINVYSDPLNPFDGTSADYAKNLNINAIEFENVYSSTTHRITLDTPENIESIRMNNTLPWTYVDASKYTIALSEYDVNCADLARNPLTPILDVNMSRSSSFVSVNDDDLGYAGVEMSSAINSDQSRYPHKLNEWDGLPEWLNNIDENNAVPEHLSVYAIHNTPFYNEHTPDSRQVAALIFDPGKEVEDPNASELTTDEYGRIYVISNDPTEYENNAISEHPKPARTVARICDIPTSVTQFMNVEGLAPVSVVDEKYVRTGTPFKSVDIERLYNTLGRRVVLPTMVDRMHIPVNNDPTQGNAFIFDNTVQDNLSRVNLLAAENDLRDYVNLAPVVDPDYLDAFISVGGTGYQAHDIGIIIIGGACMDYEVLDATPIVEEGGTITGGIVTSISVVPHDRSINISLSNFEMQSGQTGYTTSFKSSRSSGTGSGLQVYFFISNYDEIRTKQDKIKENLIAFVKEKDGLYLYTYYLNPNTRYGEYYEADTTKEAWAKGWNKIHQISAYEYSTTEKYEYDQYGHIIGETDGVSAKEAYLNTNVPSFRPIPVNKEDTDIENTETVLKTMSTSSMINVIDDEYTPYIMDNIIGAVNKTVDICGFRVTPMKTLVATSKVTSSVLEAIKNNHEGMFDSYLVWRWTDSSIENEFEFAYIYNTFSNLLNTDKTTYIPKNDLRYNSYVNTNANTTIVWDVKDYGPMMWVYSPTYNKHEKYHINDKTQEPYISYTHESGFSVMEWNDFNIQTAYDGTIPLVSANGLLNFNIMSNRMGDNKSYTPLGNEPLYQQPEYAFMTVGTTQSVIGESIANVQIPLGNWRLVFPRIASYTLKSNDGTVQSSSSLRLLQTIKGKNLNRSSIRTVTDSNDHDVSDKCIVFNETANGTQMLIHNSETNNWDII